ncbi:hypothetical protein Q31b_55220 [Novipirellula aureliae]|uniref:Uncharacterized protein n=1 Tax=Novipirellula aureliae TaxID=2527966 RepID=A0A5C6DD01_9BACT|nr:hypothetical protein Q31b_55220 [Novipirellula aureliae]
MAEESSTDSSLDGEEPFVSDRLLLDAWNCHQDADAFSILVHRYSRFVMSVCLRQCRTPEDAGGATGATNTVDLDGAAANTASPQVTTDPFAESPFRNQTAVHSNSNAPQPSKSTWASENADFLARVEQALTEKGRFQFVETPLDLAIEKCFSVQACAEFPYH